MTKKQMKPNNLILGMTAHPDDHVSFAGTVFKLQKKGFKYAEIMLSDAEESGMVENGKRIIKVDKQKQLDVRINKEFAAAVKLLKADPVVRMQLPNLAITSSKGTVLKIMKIIRELKPQMALIHSPEDYMNDHIEASKLSLEALRLAAYSFRLDLGPNFRTPTVLFFEGVNPIDVQVLVDITKEYDRKIKLLKIYGSQFGDRSFQLTEGAAKYRGYARRTKFAEAFEIPKNYPMFEIGKEVLC